MKRFERQPHVNIARVLEHKCDALGDLIARPGKISRARRKRSYYKDKTCCAKRRRLIDCLSIVLDVGEKLIAGSGRDVSRTTETGHFQPGLSDST